MDFLDVIFKNISIIIAGITTAYVAFLSAMVPVLVAFFKRYLGSIKLNNNIKQATLEASIVKNDKIEAIKHASDILRQDHNISDQEAIKLITPEFDKIDKRSNVLGVSIPPKDYI